MTTEERKVVWRIYRAGRRGLEKELGYVIASPDNFDWLLDHIVNIEPHIACDIVPGGRLEEEER